MPPSKEGGKTNPKKRGVGTGEGGDFDEYINNSQESTIGGCT